MAVKFANNVSTSLSAAINATQTTISVADASGLPTLSSGDYIYLTIDTDTNSPTIEVVKVTGVSTNTLTVVRGQDGTTASSFSNGTKIELRVTAAALDDISSAADTESVSIDGDTMTGDLTVPNLNVSSTDIDFTGSGGYVSTTGAYALRLQTNNTEALRLTSSQNAVFAGTISSGDVTSTGHLQGTKVRIGSTEVIDTNADFRAGNQQYRYLHLVGGATSISEVPDTEAMIAVADSSFSGLTGAADTGWLVYRPRVNSSSGRSGHAFYTGSPSTLALKIDSSQNATFAGTISSGAITASGPVSITGDSSYVGNYGYNTLTLQDSAGYAGLNFRHGNKNWLIRKNGAYDDLEFVYSDNASAPSTGTYTERFIVKHDGGFDFKSGAFSNVGAISSGAITSSGQFSASTNNADVAFFTSTHATTTNFYIRNSRATTGNTTSLYFAPANNIAGSYIASVATEDFSTTANRSAKLVFGVRKDGTFAEALTLADSKNATFGGTISSGAITSSAAGTFANRINLTDDDLSSSDTAIKTLNNGGLSIEMDADNEVANTDFRIRLDRSSGNSQLVLDASGNLDIEGALSSGAITSTGVSSIGSQTLYISTGNYVGVNTTAHVSTVLNVLDVDDDDVTLRLHTNTNSHKPVIRMNAKNSAGNAQYGDIKWNPDSPSFNFHVPYNEATPTLRISDGAISVDGTITASDKVVINSAQDGILDLNQATTGWNYIQYKANGTRKFYVGNNATDGFVVGSDDSGKLFKIDNFGTVNTGSANFITTGTISSGTISSGNIGIGDTALAFGSGVSTLLLQGTAANNRAGALYFREQDGTATSALYSTNGSDGYGTVLGAYQGSIKFGIGGIGSSNIALTIDTSKNATFAGAISSGAIASTGTISTTGQFEAGTNIQLGGGYNLSWGGAHNSGKPTIAANSNTLYFYPTGNVSGSRLYLNATGLYNAGSFTSTGDIYTGASNSRFKENQLRFNASGASYIDQATTGQALYFRTSNSSSLDTTWLEANSAGQATFSGNVIVEGNLTVSGTTTTIDTANLNVEDNNITLNYSTGDSSATANGAGITIQDAVDSTTDATILWDSSNDEFDFSHPVKVAGSLGVTNIVTNKVVKHNGTIFDDSNITDTGSLITLGSAATVSGTLQSDDITIKGGTGTTNTSSLTFENYADTAHLKSKYTNPNSTTETYLAFHTNKAGEENGTVSESMRLSGNDLSVNGKIKATDLQVFKALPAGGGDHDTFHWNQVHAAISDNAGANTYIILDTAIPQASSSMGGFTLICFNEYDDESEGDVIQIYGYFTPESNGGFNGFRYVCSNPDFEPTIQVGSNSSGNTAFLISGFDDTRYVVMVARDLYLGYAANSAAASWGDGWAFSQAGSTTGYSNLNTLVRIGITDTQISNITTAHNYSQVGHLPLSGGTLTGSLTAGNTIVGDQSNISMDASANGHLEIRGSGYQGAIALNSNDMHFYHNSAERGIVFGTNEINRVKITSSGQLEAYYDLNTYAAHKYYVSTSDSAHQRADARDEGTNFSRLYWYGVNDSAATSNFRHAWYDGNSYINVTADSDQIRFDHGSSQISLALKSTSGSSNPVYMTLEGRNSSSQQFMLEIANRGNHVTSSFTDKIDFSVNNNGTYYYSALRFDLYGGVETKQHIGNASSPYANDDRYFKLTNDVAGKSGTLVTADNGNTWLNADGGRDLWLNWYSLSNSSSHADLRVGDGDGGNDILTVVGVDRRVGILDASPSYPLDVAGDIRGTGMVRADSGINVHSGRISTTSSNQTGGGNVETYYQPDGNNNHTWRLIAGGTNTGYGTGAGGLGFFYQNTGGGNADYNLILNADQTSEFKGKVTISHTNLAAEPYVGLEVKNPNTSGDRLTGIAVNAVLQGHYRYMLGGVTKWQTRVGANSATDDWRLYSFTTSSDILTAKPSGEGQLRLFKADSSTQWTETSGVGSISISGYEGQSSGSNPTVAFSAGNGGYAMFYLNRMINGSETFSDSSARYFDFYRQGTSKVRMVMSASDEFGFYHATSTASTNVWGSGGTNFLEVADTGTTTLYALNVSNSAQVSGSNIFHAGYSNTWAQIPAGTRTNYTLKFKPATNNYAGFQFLSEDNAGAGYLLIRGDSDALPSYKANGISLIADSGWLTLAQRTTTNKGIRFVTQNSTNVDERAQFTANGNFLVGTTNESGLSTNSGSIRSGGTIDASIGSSGAFRFYDGTTFRGGFGTNQWASGASASNNLAVLAETGGSLFVYANGDSSTPKFGFGADGVLYPYSTRWDRTYRQEDSYDSSASQNTVYTHWGVLCAGSDNSSPEAYTIIETNIDQDAYRMGGFTILLMDKYSDYKTRARIDLAGYWNPESNGGFIGWGYTTTNTRERPTIYVMRNSSTGKVAFAYQHSAVVGASYPVILACDLWIGYTGGNEADGKNWTIKQAANLNAYTNTNQVNHVGGNGNYQNNDGSFVISKSSGTMFSHGSFSDAIGYNGNYGTYIGGPGGRYVYSGGTGTSNGGTHPYYSDGTNVQNIHHNGGQIANTFNGDHTFTNTTSSAGIKVTNNQTGGPAIKIHSTNTNGTDWWLISNSSSNTDGAGKLQLWSNNYSFAAATFGNTNLIPTNFYTPTYITSQNQPPTFTTHTTGSTRPTLLANPDGQGAHALVVNQPHSGYWSQIISTQKYGLNIDSHSSDSGSYLLAAAIAGVNQFYVRGDGVVHHRTTTVHAYQAVWQVTLITTLTVVTEPTLTITRLMVLKRIWTAAMTATIQSYISTLISPRMDTGAIKRLGGTVTATTRSDLSAMPYEQMATSLLVEM